MKATDKKFEIIWKVQHASLDCKQGVHSIEETDNEEDTGFLFNETMYGQTVDFETLKSLAHWNLVASYIMLEFTPFVEGGYMEDDEDEFTEHLDSVYDDDTTYFYERRMLTSDGTPYHVYYPMDEEVDNDTIKIAKECLDFTGKVIERKGNLK